MSDRDALWGNLVSDASDFTEYSQHNDKVIREMRPEELVHVEEELNFFEKVGIQWILFRQSYRSTSSQTRLATRSLSFSYSAPTPSTAAASSSSV